MGHCRLPVLHHNSLSRHFSMQHECHILQKAKGVPENTRFSVHVMRLWKFHVQKALAYALERRMFPAACKKVSTSC